MRITLEDLLYSLTVGYQKKYTKIVRKKIGELPDEQKKEYEKLFERSKKISKPHSVEGKEFEMVLYLFSVWNDIRSNEELAILFEKLMRDSNLEFLLKEFRKKRTSFENLLNGRWNMEVRKTIQEYFVKRHMENPETKRMKEENLKRLEKLYRAISENIYDFEVRVLEFTYEPKDILDEFLLSLAGIIKCNVERMYYELRKNLEKFFSRFSEYENNPRKYVENYFRNKYNKEFSFRYDDIKKAIEYIGKNFYKWRRFFREICYEDIESFKSYLMEKLKRENMEIIKVK